ncbi:MAG: DUF4412 domain-containing protein [Nitrospirae bacterium]|nr:DUF4412 domain-containing protein [Nitrospirota bacterium]MCL5422777.1 DUF4412 domain-containing protein [Nitrospirota bacterium]
MKLLELSFVIAAMLVFTVPAFAGWVQVDSEGVTTLISEGMLKQTSRGDDQYSILDTKKGNIIFIDSKRKAYSRESIDDFCKAVITEMSKAKKNMPGEDQGKQKGGKDAPKVSVMKGGDGGVVAGYSTVKYKVLADGKLYEEVWLTADPAVLKDLESLFKTVMKKFEKCLSSVANVADSLPLAVEESPEYKKMEQAGWQMRSKSYFGGGQPATYEVIRLEKRDIPASEFEVPSGYKKVPIFEMLFREN